MDKDIARKRYFELLNEHTTGKLSRDAFLAEIETIRFLGDDKQWRKVTADGTCLRWDGNAWQTIDERIGSPTPNEASTVDAGSSPSPGGGNQSKAGRYFKHILIRIPFVILSFFLTWVIHTYLLAGVNGGFGQGGAGNWVFSNWKNFLSSTILWGLLSGFFWMIVFTFFKVGSKQFIPTITRTPVMMIDRIHEAGNRGIGAILIGAGLALFFAPFNIITGNVGFAVALFLAIFGLSSLGWAIARFIARVWLWILRTFVKKPEDKFGINLAGAHIVMVGLIPGFIASLVLKGAFGFLTGIVLIVLGIYLFFELKSPTISSKTDMFLLFFIPPLVGMAIQVCFPDLALADNGGLSEAGGTWGQWWNSEGATRVLLYGIPPSIASALGALFPTLTPDKLVQIPPEAVGPIKIAPIDIQTDLLRPENVDFQGDPLSSEIQLDSPPLTYSEIKRIEPYRPGVVENYVIPGLKMTSTAIDWTMWGLSKVVDVATGPLKLVGIPVGTGSAINAGYVGLKDLSGRMSEEAAKGYWEGKETDYTEAFKEGAASGLKKAGAEIASDIAGNLVGGGLSKFTKWALVKDPRQAYTFFKTMFGGKGFPGMSSMTKYLTTGGGPVDAYFKKTYGNTYKYISEYGLRAVDEAAEEYIKVPLEISNSMGGQ